MYKHLLMGGDPCSNVWGNVIVIYHCSLWSKIFSHQCNHVRRVKRYQKESKVYSTLTLVVVCPIYISALSYYWLYQCCMGIMQGLCGNMAMHLWAHAVPCNQNVITMLSMQSVINKTINMSCYSIRSKLSTYIRCQIMFLRKILYVRWLVSDDMLLLTTNVCAPMFMVHMQ